MKGFKDTTRTCYSKGGPVGGPKGAAREAQVMAAFKRCEPVAKRGPGKKG